MQFGELISAPEKSAPRPAAPEWQPPAPPPAPATIKALDFGLADLDRERAIVQAAIDSRESEHAATAARLQADAERPKAGLDWLASRLNKTKRPPAEALADAARVRVLAEELADLRADAARLGGLRDAVKAESEAADFDKDIRPQLRKAVLELGKALMAARAAVRASGWEVAEHAVRTNFAMSVINERRGVQISELTVPELGLLAQWRRLLESDGINSSRLQMWLTEAEAAGFTIKEK